MRNIFAALLLALSWPQIAVADVTVERIDVVSYGIYAVRETTQAPAQNGVAMVNVEGPTNVNATRTIPGRIGVAFGFQFKIIGSPAGATIHLRKVVKLPPAGMKSPTASAPVYSYTRDDDYLIGDEPRFTGFTISDPWEIVPGTWTFELWYEGRKLAVQSFNVTP